MFEKEAEDYSDSVEGYDLKTYSISDIKEAYIAGATENGIQWHKVADGDLPKDEDFKWCISDIGNPYVARWSEILNCWEGTMCQEVCCPYAWKEIVLPEIKE